MLHHDTTLASGSGFPVTIEEAQQNVGFIVATGVLDDGALKRHFLRCQTQIKVHLGYAGDDPTIGLYARQVTGSEDYLSYTLTIAQSPSARLVVLADRDGRPYRGGIWLEDRASGERLGIAPTWAAVVLGFLAEQHTALAVIVEQLAADDRGCRGPAPRQPSRRDAARHVRAEDQPTLGRQPSAPAPV